MVHVCFGIHEKCSKTTRSAVITQWKNMKKLGKLCISCRIYGTCVFWYTCEMYQKYMFLQWKYSKNTVKTLEKLCISCRIYGACVFCIHVKCTKSTCFCSEIIVKTHENTSKPVHFMSNIWDMCILVYMWNVQKLHVSAVKTHENISKTVHFMYNIWQICILVYM
jgi:hypothetical protein